MVNPAAFEARFGRVPGDSQHRPLVDRNLLVRDLAHIGLAFGEAPQTVLPDEGSQVITFAGFRNRGADLLKKGDLAKAFYVARHQVALNDLWCNPITPLKHEPTPPDMPLVFHRKPRTPDPEARSKSLYNRRGSRYEGGLDGLDLDSLGRYLALVNGRIQAKDGDLEAGIKSIVQFTNYTRSFAVPVLRMWCTAVLPIISGALDKA